MRSDVGPCSTGRPQSADCFSSCLAIHRSRCNVWDQGWCCAWAVVLNLVPGVRALYAHGAREIVNSLTEILCTLHGMGVGSCCCCCYYYFCCCCCSCTFLHLGLRKLFAFTQQLFKACTMLLVHDDPAHPPWELPAVDKFEDLTTTKLVCE